MKITKSVIKDFEATQKESGTKVALENIIWTLSAALLKDIGVTRIITRYKKFEPSRKRKG